MQIITSPGHVNVHQTGKPCGEADVEITRGTTPMGMSVVEVRVGGRRFPVRLPTRKDAEGGFAALHSILAAVGKALAPTEATTPGPDRPRTAETPHRADVRVSKQRG